MHIPTHILSGWCVANALPLGPRERLHCMIAASIADLDGCGIAFGQEAYWRFHHTAGHNVFFGVIAAGALSAWSTTHRGLAFAAYLACFHLHLLMDYFGSGPGWAIEYLWPLDGTGWRTNYAWELTSWQNRVAFAALLAMTVVIAWRARRTPLELIAPRLRGCFKSISSARAASGTSARPPTRGTPATPQPSARSTRAADANR